MKELAKINQEQKHLIDDLQTQLDKYNHEKERLKTLADIQVIFIHKFLYSYIIL